MMDKLMKENYAYIFFRKSYSFSIGINIETTIRRNIIFIKLQKENRKKMQFIKAK